MGLWGTPPPQTHTPQHTKEKVGKQEGTCICKGAGLLARPTLSRIHIASVSACERGPCSRLLSKSPGGQSRSRAYYEESGNLCQGLGTLPSLQQMFHQWSSPVHESYAASKEWVGAMAPARTWGVYK